MGMIIKIALGLILGYVVIFAANIALTKYAFDQVTESTNKMLQQQQVKIKQQQQQQKVKIRQQQQKRLYEKRHKEELARLETQKKQQERQLAITKDRAWFKWYKEPKGCNSWESDDHMIECTNHKIRAKKQFNIMWAQKDIIQ